MERLKRLLISPWLIGTITAAAVTGIFFFGYEVYQAIAINALIREPSKIIIDDETPAYLVFAKAYQLQREGDPIEAIRLYGTLTQTAPHVLSARIRYNLGSLYLNDAAKLWKQFGLYEYIRINTLLGAAKDNLRESLTLDPAIWDARYNLEYAYRITPPPKERPKNDFQGNKGSVFATLPALPGGGP